MEKSSTDVLATSPREEEATRPSSSTASAKAPSLETVLGLRCLCIVLSYLEECEGTSLLLTRKLYWTDTILPLLRVRPKPGSTSTGGPSNPTEESQSTTSKAKHRHVFWGRNHAPIIKIPDATTRLERLNTRRWNTRHQRWRQEGPSQRIHSTSGSTTDCEKDTDHEHRQCHDFTMTALVEQEWNDTVVTNEKKGDNSGDETHGRPIPRQRSMMTNPPLLRFYNHHQNNQRRLFRAGTTCLASYPRSGNTLLRSLLETVTGFVTSSDTRPDRNLSIALAEQPPYFVGEGLAPPGCTPQQPSDAQESQPTPFLTPVENGSLLEAPPICKTHWPERIGCHSYDCHRVVLLVRNPFDATDSYWHMNLTNTHTEKVQPHVTEEHKNFYEALVRHEIIQVWMSFLDYYWKECSKHKVPLLLVRYEDLVLNPKNELQRILEFCCGSNSSNSSSTMDQSGGSDWWKRRLEEATKDATAKDSDSKSGEPRKTDNYGYRSSSSATDDVVDESNPLSASSSCSESCSAKASHPEATSAVPDSRDKTKCPSSNRSSHPSIGRSLRRGMFPESLLKAIHDFDDQPQPRGNETCGKWLERLGYHVYKQGFPNNLDKLPPIPVLDASATSNSSDSNCLKINVQDVSLELRPRNSPYGRNMRRWRRDRTAQDTQPFPTI